MTRLVKTLLIWLLVLAIPAQGAAAATMAFCGPNHHGGSAAVAQAHATGSAHAHHGDAMSAHAWDPAASAAAPVADDAPAGAKASAAPGQKCSACASCCSLGAMISPVPVVPVTVSAPTVFTVRVPTVEAFAVGGPDRPPRHVLV